MGGVRSLIERSLGQHYKKHSVCPIRAIAVWPLCSIVLSFLMAGTSLQPDASAFQLSYKSDCSTFQDLIPGQMLHGKIESGNVLCFRIVMKSGDFVRLDIQVDKFAIVKILGPDRSQTLLQVEPGVKSPRSVSWQAKQSGDHWVVLSAIPMWENDQSSGPYQLRISDLVSAVDQKRNQDKLRADPRIEELGRFAQPVRTIDPQDDDFSDLDFLESRLEGVRIVFLGESHHGNGSDFLGKTRLVKFLHQRLGFNVLVFEAGLYDMEKAWRSIHSDQQPERVLAERLWRIWRWSEQFQPLIEYAVRELRSSQALRFTGLDPQLSGRDSINSFTEDLQRLLQMEKIESPLADKSSPERTILQSLFEGAYGPYHPSKKLPPLPRQQQDFIEALRQAAEAVKRRADSPTREFWVHVLRNACVLAEVMFAELMKGNAYGDEYQRVRDEQMSENLGWLANRYFAGDKFIVWAHTYHIMRNPQMVPSTRNQMTMGHRVWEAFGDETYFLGFTSYQGAYHWVTQQDDFIFTIVPDQDQRLEFEEMMQSLEHRFAVVDLRMAKKAKSWLGGKFIARPLLHAAESAEWSKVLDALFFIKEQEPSRKISGAR